MKEKEQRTFWSLPIGTRFDDGITMWSFVKIGRFTAQYFEMRTTTMFAPWTKVSVILEEPSK